MCQSLAMEVWVRVYGSQHSLYTFIICLNKNVGPGNNLKTNCKLIPIYCNLRKYEVSSLLLRGPVSVSNLTVTSAYLCISSCQLHISRQKVSYIILSSLISIITHTIAGIAAELCVLFSNSKSQPSTDSGFVGNLICPFAMAIWLPIDIQPTNAMLVTPPTSAPCSQKDKVINLI